MINNKNNNQTNGQTIANAKTVNNPFGKADWTAVHNHLNSLVKNIIGGRKSSSDK